MCSIAPPSLRTWCNKNTGKLTTSCQDRCRARTHLLHASAVHTMPGGDGQCGWCQPRDESRGHPRSWRYPLLSYSRLRPRDDTPCCFAGASVNLQIKCKGCGRSHDVSFDADTPEGEWQAGGPDAQRLATFECRGMEPVDFSHLRPSFSLHAVLQLNRSIYDTDSGMPHFCVVGWMVWRSMQSAGSLFFLLLFPSCDPMQPT